MTDRSKESDTNKFFFSKARPTRIPSASSRVENISTEQKINYKRLGIDAAILCIIILLAFGISTIGGFVFNDHYIDNFLGFKISQTNFWPNLIIRAISKPLSQPWIIASFAYDMQNFGADISWYHIVNLILHLLSCIYFYLFVYTLARYWWKDNGKKEPVHEVALLAATLFACHPLAAETVAHIAGRQASLTACNFFLCLDFFLWAFLAVKVKVMLRNYLLMFVFFVQAVLCGIQALVLPEIMLVLALLLKPNDIQISDWLRFKWGEFAAVVLLLVLTPIIIMGGFSADFSNGYIVPLEDWHVYIASQFKSLSSYYLRCFLFPVGISIFPPHTIAHSYCDPLCILSILAVFGAIYLAYKYRHNSLLIAGLLIATFSYFVLGFFRQNEICADWRFYIPLAGISLITAAAIKPWLMDWQSNKQLKKAISVLLLILIAVSCRRCLDFRSDISLFKSALAVNKGDALAQGKLALALLDASKYTGNDAPKNKPGKKEEQNSADKKNSIDNDNAARRNEAINLAKKAIAQNSDCQPAYTALGKASLLDKNNGNYKESQFKEAEIYFRQALNLAKSQHLSNWVMFDAELDLAQVLVQLEQYKEAKELVGQALTINPDDISLNIAMGKICNASSDYASALLHLNKVFQRDRFNPDLFEPLIEAELGTGNIRLINIAYNTAKLGMSIRPSHKLRIYLAQTSLALGNLNEAMQWIQIALSEEPADPQAQYIASFVLLAEGKHKDAAILKKKALTIDPNLAKKIRIIALNKERTKEIPFPQLYPAAVK